MARRKKAKIKKAKKAKRKMSAEARAKISAYWAKRREQKELKAPKKAVKRYKTGARKGLGKLLGFASGSSASDTNIPQTVSRENNYDTGYTAGLNRPMPGGIDDAEKRHIDTLSRVEQLEEQLLQYQQDLIDAVADSEKSRLRLASRIKNLT